MRKVIVSVLAISILMIMALPASAVDAEPATPRFTYIRTVSAGLTINESLGTATCSASISTRYANPVKITVRLQQYKNGVWTTLKTWSDTGTTSVVCSGQYAIYSGYTYRVYATGYFYNSEGVILESGSAIQEKEYS